MPRVPSRSWSPPSARVGSAAPRVGGREVPTAGRAGSPGLGAGQARRQAGYGAGPGVDGTGYRRNACRAGPDDRRDCRPGQPEAHSPAQHRPGHGTDGVAAVRVGRVRRPTGPCRPGRAAGIRRALTGGRSAGIGWRLSAGRSSCSCWCAGRCAAGRSLLADGPMAWLSAPPEPGVDPAARRCGATPGGAVRSSS